MVNLVCHFPRIGIQVASWNQSYFSHWTVQSGKTKVQPRFWSSEEKINKPWACLGARHTISTFQVVLEFWETKLNLGSERLAIQTLLQNGIWVSVTLKIAQRRDPSRVRTTSLSQGSERFPMACQMDTWLLDTIQLHTKPTPRNPRIHQTKSGIIPGKQYQVLILCQM